MAELVFAAEALADLAAIFTEGDERWGPEAAAAYILQLRETLEILERHPESSGSRPELGASMRSRRYRSHIIYYEFDPSGLGKVTVARILHAAMDATRLLG